MTNEDCDTVASQKEKYNIKKYQPEKSFLPSDGSKPDDKKSRSSIVRKGIYLLIFCVALFAGYFAFDISQAKRMAADACLGAIQGMPLEDYLSKFPAKDYRIARGSDYVMIVPKKGMGRNHCKVSHDGEKITGSKAGFND